MHRQGLTVLGAVAALALVACGSSGGNGAGGTTSSSTGSSSSTARTGSAAGTVHADLKITGALTATLQGTKGRCDRSETIGNEVVLEASDYPDLGSGGVFQLSWGGPSPSGGTAPPSIKIVTSDGGFLSGADVSGITINPEGTIVRLDQTVSGGAGGGPVQTATVTGQVSCP